MNDEIIKGIFYERELQLSKNTTGEYIIEKILKTKGIIFLSIFLLNGEDIQIILIHGLTNMT